MDKVIEEEVKTQKKKKAFSFILISAVILVAAIWLVRTSFASSLKKSNITTAVVERGDIENTISATGEILPEFEEIITSPINASIQNVVMDAGNKVKAGQSILALDKSASQTEYEKEKFELESKRNDIAKLKLDLDKSFYDIKSNNDIKQLRINSLAGGCRKCKTIIQSRRRHKRRY